MKTQAEDEISVFHDFALDANLNIDFNSIVSKEPPHPDIFCIDVDGNPMPFEITEIIDSQYASLNSLFYASIVMVREYHKSLSIDIRNQFDEKYKGYVMFINFKNDSKMLLRKKSLPKIFEFLRECIINQHTRIEFDLVLPSECLQSINLSRTQLNNPPTFESSFCTSTIANPITTLINKSNKIYKSEHPLRLLAYWKSQPMLPDDCWLNETTAQVDALFLQSPFIEYWIYDWSNREVKLKRVKLPS